MSLASVSVLLGCVSSTARRHVRIGVTSVNRIS